MMEIPAGEACKECLCGAWDPDAGGIFGCRLFLEYGLFPWYETEHGKKQVEEAQRCFACLSAYPNGATIEIKPK